jgi:hypothetical protein
MVVWREGAVGGVVECYDDGREGRLRLRRFSKHGGLNVVEHGGGIEGFNTQLAYVPERRIAVMVLSNVNGTAPGAMGSQLLDVALGLPVELASERKAVAISKEELAKFVGVYELTPSFSLTTAVGVDGLTVQGTGQPAVPLIYTGVKDGHPRFFQTKVNAELEFVPDASWAMTGVVLHQGGHDSPGKRR